ncbi:MAG TPA: fused response regulator/phosphatase [Jatrophihabitans sp.]|jgi:CheY-like chemotaxis protein|nr:fused response regulator/phosphatase [Jatrophihabitans sp.]
MTSGSAPTGTILLVDDVEGGRVVFASWLRRAGHTVIEADTGAAALDAVAQHSIDLVILDIHLPDMSGFEVREQVKGNRATSAIPILHISATATDPADRSVALNAGADGYLFEPVERDELLATVSSLLRYHEARRTAERLALRLERLHEATLLMSAASTLTELLQFACTGLVSVFGAPVVVALSMDTVGRVAQAGPNSVDPVVKDCRVADVAELAGHVSAGRPPQVSHLGAEVPAGTVPPMGCAITSPRGEQAGAALVFMPVPAPDDMLMLDQFAQALAVTLEKQRLFTVEHKIALTLQRAMLPASIPQVDYLQVAVRYLAASDTAEIGGDFYEALAVDSDRMLLAVGDVVGHSLQAATVMAELRHSLRALAGIGMTAAEIMQRLDLILQESHPGMTATVCIAEVHRDGTVAVTNAGHIPPVIAEAGAVRVVDVHGPLLGLHGSGPIPTHHVNLAPDGTLVLLTDGLIERRNEDLQIGLARLADCLANGPPDAEQACDKVLAELTDSQALFDDIALVAARRIR